MTMLLFLWAIVASLLFVGTAQELKAVKDWLTESRGERNLVRRELTQLRAENDELRSGRDTAERADGYLRGGR